VEQWAVAEVDAYCAEMPEMDLLTNEELQAIIDAPPEQSEALFARFGGCWSPRARPRDLRGSVTEVYELPCCNELQH
jgi:hypothetical protein